MYKLKKLPYEFDSLEPFIDTHTLGLHKNKHQQNYLNKLNELLIKNNFEFQYPIEELFAHINEFPSEDHDIILFNLGGVINHDIYFKSMNPNRELPNENLLQKINAKYNNLENFKQEFKAKALSIKGSGYTFLIFDGENIDIVNFLN